MLAVKEVLEKDYENRMINSFLKGANLGLEAGMADGKATGEIAGKRAGKIEDAKNMLKKNIDIDIIEEVTGLKREEFI